MGYEQAKLRGAASYVSWVVTRTLSLTTRQSARRDPYGRLPDALGMCDDLRWAGRSARFSLCLGPPLMGVSPLHASNRPFGWPAADMRRQGLFPEGLPLRARARSSIDPEYPTGMRSIIKTGLDPRLGATQGH